MSGRSVVAFEAWCPECAVVFNPADESDTVHAECGTAGELCGAWLAAPRLVASRHGLDALPVGTFLRDRDDLPLLKTDPGEFESWSPEDDRWFAYDTGEIAGEYADPEEGSAFLPAVVTDPPYGRCDARARRGTGEGVCDRPLDDKGTCDRAADHIEGA